MTYHVIRQNEWLSIFKIIFVSYIFWRDIQWVWFEASTKLRVFENSAIICTTMLSDVYDKLIFCITNSKKLPERKIPYNCDIMTGYFLGTPWLHVCHRLLQSHEACSTTLKILSLFVSTLPLLMVVVNNVWPVRYAVLHISLGNSRFTNSKTETQCLLWTAFC